MGLPVVILTESGDTSLHLPDGDFTVTTLPLGLEENFKCPNLDLKTEQRREIISFLRALAYGDNELGLLLLRDSAQTLLAPAKLAELLAYTRGYHTFDVLYLGRYLDRCDLYTEVGTWEHLRLMATKNSNGSFALYFSPQGLRKLRSPSYFEPYSASLGRNLSGHVFNGKLTALTTEPPVFTHRIRSDQDWVKTHACKVPLVENQPQLSNSVQPLSFWWFLLIVLGLIALALLFWPR